MQWRNIEEAMLLRAVRAGAPGAFDRLINRYEKRIYNLALRMLYDAHEAEDATQEAFVAVYSGLPSYKGGSSLDTWIHRVAVNVCLQHRRRHSPEPASLDDRGGGVDTLAASSPDPLTEALRTELCRALSDALRRLPEAQQTAVLLHGMQGFTYAEVATILECPVGTVKSRINTAFGQLRRSLEEYVQPQPTLAAAGSAHASEATI